MNKFLLTYLLAILPVSVFASQQQLQTRANTTSPSVDTNFTRQQAMNTDLYTNKADKSSAVLNWSAWANGASFTTSSPPVAYNGVLYKCIAPYTKNSGETPDTQTEYFAVVGGVGGTADYNALTNKPTIPSALSDLSADSTHRVVTDAEKSAWNAKQSPLTAGTDYLAPTGSAAGLTNFPSTLATDSEVTTAVSGKANTSAFASSAAFQAAFGWSPGSASMLYPGVGIPVSTGSAWGTSITLGTGVQSALGHAPDSIGGFLNASTYLANPLISWDSATITETVDTPTAGTNTIGVKSGVFQAYDVDLNTWAGITPGTGVGAFLATPSSANLATAVTGETGSGSLVFGTSPTIITPEIVSAEVNGSVTGNLTAANVSSTIVTNRGMEAADVALTLPTAAAGYAAIFTVGTSQGFKWGVRAGVSDKIYLLAADGTISAGSDNGYARMTVAQVGQAFACWTFKTDAYDWQCKAISSGTSTFAAN